MADDKVLEKLTKKVDGVADDVRTLTYRVDKLEATTNERFDRVDERFDSVDKGLQVINDQLKTLSNQFSAVTSKVIEHDKLLTGHEERIAVLESETH
jgi:uncharacterized protein YoxC